MWQWKCCEIVLLVLVTVITVSINAVPALLYFTLQVSVHVYIYIQMYTANNLFCTEIKVSMCMMNVCFKLYESTDALSVAGQGTVYTRS